MCERPGQNLMKVIPILRSSDDDFLRFGRSRVEPVREKGRLSQFLPTKTPSARARTVALRRLDRLLA
jgi:hypothetical protein